MIYKGIEIVTTLNNDGLWYATLIDEKDLDRMPQSEAFSQRIAAIRRARVMVDCKTPDAVTLKEK